MSYSSPRFSLHRPEDEIYFDKVRQILAAPPCKGIPHEPDLLMPHVYIGNQRNAESLRLLRKYGITHVLNVAGYTGPRTQPHASPYQGLDIDYLEIQAEDHDTYDITQHFSQCFSYLDRVKRQGGVALVHCALGVNRSGAICAAYMMVTSRCTLLETVKTLKNKRHIVLSNHGFQRQLVRYARAKGLLDDIHEQKDDFDREKEKIRASLRRYQEDLNPSASSSVHKYAMSPSASMPDHVHAPLRRSDSCKDERDSHRQAPMRQSTSFYSDVYCSPTRQPNVRYLSMGRRSHLSLPASLVTADDANGNSIFESYLERTRAYAYHN